MNFNSLKTVSYFSQQVLLSFNQHFVLLDGYRIVPHELLNNFSSVHDMTKPVLGLETDEWLHSTIIWMSLLIRAVKKMIK